MLHFPHHTIPSKGSDGRLHTIPYKRSSGRLHDVGQALLRLLGWVSKGSAAVLLVRLLVRLLLLVERQGCTCWECGWVGEGLLKGPGGQCS